jgi:large subunit ribosomal protein L25
MAGNASLGASPRAGTGKGSARKLRATGRVPAVIYGHGEATRLLSMDAHELSVLFSRIRVESTVIDVTIEGEPVPVKALVREVQKHVVRDEFLHVDLYQIHAGERITVEISLRLVGAAPGVKAGGLLQQALSQLEVRCLPDSIPDVIEVDISALEIGDSIHVGEITAPAGVEVLVDADRTVCSVQPPAVEAVPETVAEPAAEASTEPEVIAKGKTDEDEDEK